MSERTVGSHHSKRGIADFALKVAQSHLRGKPEDTDIYVSCAENEVRLVEVGEQYPDTEEILPFHFGAEPARGFDYPVVIVLHSRETWKRHPNKSVLLPEGWHFDDFQRLDELQ